MTGSTISTHLGFSSAVKPQDEKVDSVNKWITRVFVEQPRKYKSFSTLWLDHGVTIFCCCKYSKMWNDVLELKFYIEELIDHKFCAAFIQSHWLWTYVSIASSWKEGDSTVCCRYGIVGILAIDFHLLLHSVDISLTTLLTTVSKLYSYYGHC